MSEDINDIGVFSSTQRVTHVDVPRKGTRRNSASSKHERSNFSIMEIRLTLYVDLDFVERLLWKGKKLSGLLGCEEDMLAT